MSKSNYAECEYAVRRWTPFEGNSMSGHDGPPRWWGRHYGERPSTDDVIFTVLSYSTPIGIAYGDGSVWITGAKYSMTSGRHISIVRRAWADLPIKGAYAPVFGASA